jgi:DMSO/TMAO reductase YedYZ molybdopterin-dependent catalytic subunit
MKRNALLRFILPCCLVLTFMLPLASGEAPEPTLRVGGAVKQALSLTMKDLARMQSVSVRLNEISEDGQYGGVYHYSGIPLRSILELAGIEKKGSAFNKLNDLAVVVKDKAGKTAVLSWGEIFYRNPGEIVVALSAMPVMPHKKCSNCHVNADFYQERLSQLSRPIGFPRLAVANDFYSDRSLEGIQSIEVVDLKPVAKTQRLGDKLFSSKLIISGDVEKTQSLEDLSSYPREEVLTKAVGEGIGYHGIKHFSGASLAAVLQKAGLNKDPKTVFLVSAPDGYQSVVSYGELFYTKAGERILLADRSGKAPLKKNGRFMLILPDDQAADRWVKAVGAVEVIRLK